MDISLIVGLLVSFGALGVGMIMEGAELFGFIGISPAMIVFGSTLGIILVAHPIATVKRIPKLIGIAMRGNAEDSNELVTRLVDLAEKARREGLLSLAEEAANMDDPFIKKGLMLVIDGTDPDQVRDILEIEIERMEERHKAGYKLFEDGGGYAPTVGIIGHRAGPSERVEQPVRPVVDRSGDCGGIPGHALWRGFGQPLLPAGRHQAQRQERGRGHDPHDRGRRDSRDSGRGEPANRRGAPRRLPRACGPLGKRDKAAAAARHGDQAISVSRGLEGGPHEWGEPGGQAGQT